MSSRPYVVVIPAQVMEADVTGSLRGTQIEIRIPVGAPSVQEAAKIVGEALHLAALHGAHAPIEDAARSALLELPLRSPSREAHLAVSALASPRPTQGESHAVKHRP